MKYTSILHAPPMEHHFQHAHRRVMPHSQGHDVLSDFADRPHSDPVFGLYKNCGFWTDDEAAILYNTAIMNPGWWVDIGCHTGWTTMHIAEARGCNVVAVDPMLAVPEFHQRFQENTWEHRDTITERAMTSQEFFATASRPIMSAFDGFVIDGDHEPGQPLQDVQGAFHRLKHDAVILLHDFIGAPVQEAAVWLMDNGFRCTVYYTPHMIAALTRGDALLPIHNRDPNVDWASVRRGLTGFPFARCL